MKHPILQITMVVLPAFALAAAALATAPDVEVVEYYHPETRHFFMTSRANEQRLLDGLPAEFKRTGHSFAAWSAGANAPAEAVAVTRFFNPKLASHVFTSRADEVALLRSLTVAKDPAGFVDEGVAFLLPKPSAAQCPVGQIAVYRAYNNRADGNHRYSNDLGTQAAMMQAGFVHEGVAFCSPVAQRDVAVEKRAGAPRATGEDVTVSGAVSAFTSVADFMIGPQKINAANARFDGAAASALVAGASVRVEGVVIGGVLMATEINFLSALVAAVDEFKGFVTARGTGGVIFVNGTAVDTSAAVVTGSLLQQVSVGTELELHGNFRDGTFVATRVHIEDSPNAPEMSGAGVAELKGSVSTLVGVSDFRVNDQKVDASSAVFEDGTAANLVNGTIVEVKGKIVSGVLVASHVEFKVATAASPNSSQPDAIEFEAKGVISDFTAISSFSLGGRLIDATAAVILRGSAADIKNGARVEIKGVLVNGVVKASQVKFDDDVAVGGGLPDGAEFEASGKISAFVSVSSFVLSGQTIDASGASFERGTTANLSNGVTVEIKGRVSNGVVKATRVRFER